jgi:hypothetical protein
MTDKIFTKDELANLTGEYKSVSALRVRDRSEAVPGISENADQGRPEIRSFSSPKFVRAQD